MKKGWAEVNRGADIRIPGIFKFIMKYVTPLYLIVILIAWTYQDDIGYFFMEGVSAVDKPYHLLARILMIAIILFTIFLVRLAWRKRNPRNSDSEISRS